MHIVRGNTCDRKIQKKKPKTIGTIGQMFISRKLIREKYSNEKPFLTRTRAATVSREIFKPGIVSNFGTILERYQRHYY